MKKIFLILLITISTTGIKSIDLKEKPLYSFTRHEMGMDNSSKVTQIIPKEGEIARWEVVMKMKLEKATPIKTTQEILIKELSENSGFIKWWNSERVKGIPVQKSLAIIYTIDNDFWGRTKAEIAFLPYLKQAVGVIAYDSGPAAIVYYDVKAIEPITNIEVKLSDVELLVWSHEDLNKLKINNDWGFIRAKNKNGGLIPFDEVNPHYMYSKY